MNKNIGQLVPLIQQVFTYFDFNTTRKQITALI